MPISCGVTKRKVSLGTRWAFSIGVLEVEVLWFIGSSVVANDRTRGRTAAVRCCSGSEFSIVNRSNGRHVLRRPGGDEIDGDTGKGEAGDANCSCLLVLLLSEQRDDMLMLSPLLGVFGCLLSIVNFTGLAGTLPVCMMFLMCL